MQKRFFAGLLLCVCSFLSAETNLWQNSGFETWNEKNNMPSASAWRWGISKSKEGNEFEFFGRSAKEKHSGKYSLYMKDVNPGNLNNSFHYRFKLDEAKQLGGKILTFAAWVKQIRSSAPRKVGIAIVAFTADKKRVSAADWIDTTEETGWTHLVAKLKVPENTLDLRAILYCANHYHNTGEAYFDDVILTTGTVQKQQSETLKKVAKKSTKNPFFLQIVPAPRAWQLRFRGVKPAALIRSADFVLKKAPTKQPGPLVSILCLTDLLNRRYSLKPVPQGELTFQAKLSANIPLWVNLIGADSKKYSIHFKNGEPDGKGFFVYRKKFTEHPEELKTISIQISRNKIADIPEIRCSDFGLLAPKGIAAAKFAPSPWAEKYIQKYREPAVYTDDGYKRPVIKDGTWFEDGEYKFLLGPWIGRKLNDWRDPVRNNPLKINHIAYTNPPSKLVFDAMGFNSAQLSAAPSFPGQGMYGLGIPDTIQNMEKEFTQLVKGMEGMSLVVDFAFSYDRELEFEDPERRRRVDQRCGTWHSFVPTCPELPDGWKYYRDLMSGGTKILMKDKMNVSVYELFNESVYGCQCSFNIKSFAGKMEKKYGSIERANKTWGTIFTNFDELANSTGLEQYPGLWVEWWNFIANRYGELLIQCKNLVREIDKRPDVFFCDMLAMFQLWNGFMDYRIIADKMDLLAIEGGWRYGFASDSLHSTNGMEDVVFATGTHWYISDYFSALAKGKKPVINNEHYCWRAEYGLRVPSKRTDMATSLWMELMHGSSGNFTYVLNKRSYEYKTMEEAKQSAINPSHRSSVLLNPYNWPPSELVGFKMFRDEMEPYKDKILPFPRTKKPTVAIYHSYVTHAMNLLKRGMDFRARMQRWYSVLLHNQYPVTFVFDNDLINGVPENIEAIIVPCAEYESDEAIAGFRKFIERGGTVIADQESFRYTSHAKKRPNAVLPGVVFANSRKNNSDVVILKTLAKKKVTRYGTLEPADTLTGLGGTDLQIIDRGDFKLVFVAGMLDLVPRKVKMKLLLKDQGEFYLTDIINKRLYRSPSGETWNMKQLRDGFELVLPPQERVVFVLERKRPQNVQNWTPADVQKQFDAEKPAADKLLREFEERKKADKKAKLDARVYRDVNPAKCKPLNIRKAVNMHYRDEKGDDRKGGGFDQGAKDFSNIRPGRVVAAGVPFDLIDSDKNNGKGLIILAGRHRNYFPLEVMGIPVNRKAKALYFLHTMGWGAPKGEKVMSYWISYADGTRLEVPIRSMLEIAPWMSREGVTIVPNAKVAIESSHSEGTFHLQNYRWTNPHPAKVIKSIDIVSTCGGGVPAIAAITLEQTSK